MKTIFIALHNKGLYRKAVFVIIFIASIGYAGKPGVSDDFTDRRFTAGAKIFRALLAADVDIAQKKGTDGNLRLCLLYSNDAAKAEKVARTLQSRDDSRIRKIDVVAEVLPYNACINVDKEERLAGIFLTESLSDENLKTLISYANKRNLIVFSPIEGDVERGVHSGIAVEARVRPYLNTEALRSADVRLKPFFIRVSKQYEE